MSNHPFDLLMELDAEQIRLDWAALHLAKDVYTTVNVTRYVRLLDDLAEEVAAARPGLAANLRYRALQRVLVESFGLTGDRGDYYHPDTCYLNRVLDRRRGAPISLAVVWIEVARRLKWPLTGVALPGHFIVRLDDPERFLLIDPFHDGRPISIEDCEDLVEERLGGSIRFTTDLLEPVGTRSILLRLLRNLRNIYLTRNDLGYLAVTLRRLAAIEPTNGRHLQDLAAVCCRRGDVRGAAAHLALYLHRTPHAEDSPVVRRNLQQLHAALLARN
ncbi:MAG: transglutaminase-like domain-containing protein [Planctomycetota bacterium]